MSKSSIGTGSRGNGSTASIVRASASVPPSISRFMLILNIVIVAAGESTRRRSAFSARRACRPPELRVGGVAIVNQRLKVVVPQVVVRDTPRVLVDDRGRRCGCSRRPSRRPASSSTERRRVEDPVLARRMIPGRAALRARHHLIPSLAIRPPPRPRETVRLERKPGLQEVSAAGGPSRLAGRAAAELALAQLRKSRLLAQPSAASLA
jgi:hypothetical protein